MVVFHYRLRSDRGTVLMRAFRQACRHCSGKYEKPGFTKQAVEELLLRLMGKIKKNCYGCADDGEYNPVCSETVRTKPHESSLCEACSQGICCKDE
ncbi:RTP3 protein, partial [Amia calva]|nr:RTP3 protein [Amia calva]